MDSLIALFVAIFVRGVILLLAFEANYPFCCWRTFDSSFMGSFEVTRNSGPTKPWSVGQAQVWYRDLKVDLQAFPRSSLCQQSQSLSLYSIMLCQQLALCNTSATISKHLIPVISITSTQSTNGTITHPSATSVTQQPTTATYSPMLTNPSTVTNKNTITLAPKDHEIVLVPTSIGIFTTKSYWCGHSVTLVARLRSESSLAQKTWV